MKIGIFLPLAETDEGSIARFAEIRALAEGAEQAGFDSLWIMDHLLFRHREETTRGTWEAWTVLAALAALTERVELGTLVLAASFRNPALLAKMATTLDEISNGRLILGLGAGWHEPEFDAFGYPFDHRVDRFEEAIGIIAPLLRTGRVDVVGRYSAARNCEILPRGPRPAGPPLLIGSRGPRMLGILARYADQWNTCWLGEPQHTNLAAQRAALAAACHDVGRDPASVAVTVGVRVAGPGYSGDPDPATLIQGTPAAVAATLREYEALGVAHLICWPQPNTIESLDWLAQGLQQYRGAAGSQ